MKTNLRLHLGQNVAMTPQLVQSIRMLQLSALELEQEVLTALDRNVMLERDEDDADAEPALDAELTEAPVEAAAVEVDWDAALSESWEAKPAPATENQPERAAPEVAQPHLRALSDLELLLDDAREARIATAILDAIDENGYLERPLDALRAQLPADWNVAPAEMESVLAKVQQLDPPGFGARDLRECLDLQLRALDPATPGLGLARCLVAHGLEALAGDELAALDEKLDPAPQMLDAAVALVRRLNPKPAASVGEDAEYVVPDLVLRPAAGGWRLELNRAATPRVRVNSLYEGLLNRCKEDGKGLREQLLEARWLVRGLEMRHDTLLRAARAIFERQNEFLDRGDEGMKPLTLKEVAEAIGMHESTVSRITTRKYVQTPRGVFELKYFFSSSLAARDGAEASGTAVRAMIRRLIEQENRATPMCDGTIATLLGRRGIRVARRTVAKYREAMGIPPAKERGRAATRTALRAAG
ncbi:MAG: RNA polymerase factor sigma-54 [Gammaproteobacteria bacterium]|nr:RNA polymerase factor sigma-54 [Gammaproteobacteria bacterium]